VAILSTRDNDIGYVQHFQRRDKKMNDIILNDRFRCSKAIANIALNSQN